MQIGTSLRALEAPLREPAAGPALAAGYDRVASRPRSDRLRPFVLISSLSTAGAERVTVSFLRRLVGTEAEAVVCTVTSRHDGPLATELRAAGVLRHDLCARRLADPFALLRLVQLIRSERPSLLHAHGQDASILGVASRFLTGVPFIVTRHVLDEPANNWRQHTRARSALVAARYADAVVAVSSATADRLSVIAGLPRAAIRVIPNGIEFERFQGPAVARRAGQVRQALGCAPQTPLVLVPAALREGKGHEVLMAAFPQLKEQIPSIRILFAGSGEREEALRAQARPYGEAFLFLGLCDDMPALLSACDLVVLSSLAEALPTALMEAAAAGKPAVATRVGGTPDVVEHGRTGLLVPPNDPAALAQAMAALLAHPGRARTYGETARQRAIDRFGIDLQVKRTLELWAEVRAKAHG